jgi:hypothetical protein
MIRVSRRRSVPADVDVAELFLDSDFAALLSREAVDAVRRTRLVTSTSPVLVASSSR